MYLSHYVGDIKIKINKYKNMKNINSPPKVILENLKMGQIHCPISVVKLFINELLKKSYDTIWINH